ncbi:epimerase [Gallibacterium salpingitidis]|uniref:Epimerase n=1 Tax=Gallibacterium salpingitidis TaxID=505341 RepID=A0AB36E0M2_9PAST|nr:NAD(P)-dependent oxidoreductase [Gallibacterium salpingitidis]OBX08055.1 epimerase [Gallibacterium salpingitidis]
MKILVTGGRGFIGRNLILFLRKNTSYDIFGDKDEDICDIMNITSISLVLNKIRPDMVIHLAALTFVPSSNPIDFYKVNTIGSENLFKCIIENDVSRYGIVCFSTAGVYGIQQEKYLNEELIPNPINHYSMSKYCMEQLVKKYNDRRNIVIIRPFNILGDGQDINFLIPKLIDKFANRVPLIELGNLDSIRDFIYIEDLCSILLKLINLGCNFGTINICSGKGYSVCEIFEFLCDISGYRPKIEQKELFIRKDDIHCMVGDTTKLFSILRSEYQFTSIKEILKTIYTNKLMKLED